MPKGGKRFDVKALKSTVQKVVRYGRPREAREPDKASQ